MKKHLSLYLILFLVLIFASSCGLGGTDTGNPGDTGDTQDMPTSPNSSNTRGIEYIISGLCSKLVSCHPTLDQSDCEEGLYVQSNIDTELGLGLNEYATLTDVLDAENAFELEYSATDLQSCLTGISALTCSSTALQTAYTQATPQNFNNVYRMIPTASCGMVY